MPAMGPALSHQPIDHSASALMALCSPRLFIFMCARRSFAVLVSSDRIFPAQELFANLNFSFELFKIADG